MEKKGEDMHILVTGGAGYIGSHTCLELLNKGEQVTVIDDLSNSSLESLRRVEKLAGRGVNFHQVDILDREGMAAVFGKYEADRFDAVIHFAGKKAVGESVEKPLLYYHNNITGTLNLLAVMEEFAVRNIIFSSSATVYGDPATLPITEDFPLSCTNPYGWTKLMIEQILSDMQYAHRQWNVCLLRYFNPVGAHKSGLIGEDPNGIPNNLMPYISQVAVGKLASLSVFGNDYPTPDGSGVRDFIHVVDLALGHVAALTKFAGNPGRVVYNLGTGKGYSVLQMVAAFARACGREIPYTIVGRRAGDIAACYADPGKALRELGWSAKYGLQEMCEDSWRWQVQNPDGFSS